MIKSENGKVEIDGSVIDIGADIGCLIVTYKDILLKSGLSEETANNMIQTTADAAINYRNRNKKAKNQDEPVRAMLGLIKGL